jgi:general secretion pathway protein L
LTASPEKIFFTGPGALYSGLAEQLTRFLELPAEQINMCRDTGVDMDASISQTWNPALMDPALALALRNGRKGARFNLRKEEFVIQKPYLGIKKEIRRLGILLFFILAFFIADQVVDFYILKDRYLNIKGRVEEIFQQALPNEPYTADAVARIERKISDIKNGSDAIPGIQADERVLDLILDISDRIPKEMDVLVTRMVIDPEAVRISGITDNFNSVDSIKSGLEPSKYFREVTISSANLDKTGKQVKFELKLQRGE